MTRKIILTDMQLEYVGDLHTNYHSRTLLPGFAHIPGGETTATMRLRCDSSTFKGNVQYPESWMRYVVNILNNGNKSSENYLFRKAGGIQNSSIKGRMEQVMCEGNIVEVYKKVGSKCFIRVFHTDELPPTKKDLTDPRIQRITVVNKLDQLTRSTSQEVYFPLMARPGEELWIDEKYLTDVVVEPLKPRAIKQIIIFSDYSIKETPL